MQDKIRVQFEKSAPLVNQALETHSQYICKETQAESLSIEESLSDGKILEMDEIKLKVKIEV